MHLLSCLQFQFLTAEEAPEEPPPVTDSATLKHFAREAEVDHDWLCGSYFVTQYPWRILFVHGFVKKNTFLQLRLFPLFYFFIGEPKLWAGCQILPGGICFKLSCFFFVPVTKGNVWLLRLIETILTTCGETFIIVNVVYFLLLLSGYRGTRTTLIIGSITERFVYLLVTTER